MSTVISSQIQLWRQKALDGTITVDELKEAIAAIRKERYAASAKSETSRTKRVEAKQAIDTDAMLGELF